MEGGSLARPSRVHEDTLTAKGWSFRARTAPIISSTLLEQYSEQLGGVLTLPEITFGNSTLQIRHEASGVVLQFTALDALKQWKKDDLPPLKVNVAQQWQAARAQEIQKQQAIVLEYDWTYTTSYQGSITCSPPLFGPTDHKQEQLTAIIDQAQPGLVGSTKPVHAPAAATAAAIAPAADAQTIDQLSSSSQHSNDVSKQLPQWQPSNKQIDRGMLMSKDEPILFYAEVPLYESELDDNGACQLTVKVRYILYTATARNQGNWVL